MPYGNLFVENLKALRKEHGNTQEELADYLCISAQAVSKWERNEGSPDLSLLPQIAGFYHTTVDRLLGVDEIARQARADALTAGYNQLRHHVPLDPGYRLDEGIELIRNPLIEVPGDFFFEQLLAADLSYKGKQTSAIDTMHRK